MSVIQLDFTTTDPKLVELCTKYWEVDSNLNFAHKTTDIAKELGVRPNQLAATITGACKATTVGDECERCGKAYYFSSRTEFVTRHRRPLTTWICEECRRVEAEKKAAERAAYEAKQQERMRARFANQKRGPTDPRSLSLDDAVYLVSLFRLGATEDLRYIKSLASFEKGSLSPSADFDKEIFEQLFAHDLLFIHPESPVEAFNEDLTRFALPSVIWWLPQLTPRQPSSEFIAELEAIFQSNEWAPSWFEESRSLWRRIALEECLQYLDFCLGEHGFIHAHGEKTIHSLNYVLSAYSVSQTFNFIWRAAKDAAAFYMRERVPKQQAANTVVGSIQRQADKAKSEGWNIKGFQRNFKAPQSMVSRVFSDTVMQFGDSGFELSPGGTAGESDDEDSQFEDV